MDKYKLLEMIGAGSYGEVHRALDRATNNTVAVKRISFDKFKKNEGVPGSIIREVSFLEEFDHKNIISLLDVLDDDDGVFLVFEYLEYDLARYMRKQPYFMTRSIKNFLYQILSAVAYCHDHKIVHQDLKPENLLIDQNGDIVKVADFGLAKEFGVPASSHTKPVGTLPYRAPEVLLGSTKYSAAVDIWAVGCIFAELVMQKPLFSGSQEHDVAKEIFKILGIPDEVTWPGVTRLVNYKAFARHRFLMSPGYVERRLRDVVTNLEESGLQLLSSMLTLNPRKRISVANALSHEYFNSFIQSGSSFPVRYPTA